MNTLDALYTIKYNPFKFGEYLATFYMNLTGVKQNILLAPLLIPLFTHPVFKQKLKNAKSTSSLHTIFSNSNGLYDLQERIDVLRILTSESIQYCLLNQWLEIDIDNLSIHSVQEIHNVKIAKNLARLFSNYSVHEIYMILGVKP
ncbi:three component ABC system middle component [[Pasteurella] aerogenes]|nr:three component ABC system middle component [[Pasteurella] aerogenes]